MDALLRSSPERPELKDEDEAEDSEEMEDVPIGSLQEKSKQAYSHAYAAFNKWKSQRKAKVSSESVVLAYFADLSRKYKPSTLWTFYSMLKAMLNKRENINMEKYAKVTVFLKEQSDGYQPKKATTFTTEQILKFITQAPDKLYLPTKVALIMGVLGACRSRDLYLMKMSDIRDLGDMLIVSKPFSKAKKPETFTVTNQYYKICKKYLGGRTAATEALVFYQYRHGKIIKQRIGINTFAKMGRDIANYLKLPKPEMFSGHSFRRTSETILVDSSGNISALERRRGSTSSTSTILNKSATDLTSTHDTTITETNTIMTETTINSIEINDVTKSDHNLILDHLPSMSFDKCTVNITVHNHYSK